VKSDNCVSLTVNVWEWAALFYFRQWLAMGLLFKRDKFTNISLEW